MGSAESAGVEKYVFPREPERAFEGCVRFLRPVALGVHAIRQKQKSFRRNAFGMQEGIAQSVGNGVHKSSLTISPTFKTVEQVQSCSCLEQSHFNQRVRPKIGDIEDQRNTLQERINSSWAA